MPTASCKSLAHNGDTIQVTERGILHRTVEMDVANPSPKRILVVEDEVAVALELEAILYDAGHTTVGPAVTPDEARRLIKTDSIDYAILDVGMVLDGGSDILGTLAAKNVRFAYL